MTGVWVLAWRDKDEDLRGGGDGVSCGEGANHEDAGGHAEGDGTDTHEAEGGFEGSRVGGGEGTVVEEAGGGGVVLAERLEAADKVVAGGLEESALRIGGVDDDALEQKLGA